MSRYSDKEGIIQISKEGETWELLSWDTTEESFRPLGDSELQRVVEFNERAGIHQEYREVQDQKVGAQMYLIIEESSETRDAFFASDRKELVDGCCDLITVAAGMLHRLGYNPDKAMKIVSDSNMSKFVDPDNKEDVEASIRKYDNDHRYTDVHVDERGAVWGTVVATGSKKILKSVNYKEPQWQQLDRGLA